MKRLGTRWKVKKVKVLWKSKKLKKVKRISKRCWKRELIKI
jgi:hypothetical protein